MNMTVKRLNGYNGLIKSPYDSRDYRYKDYHILGSIEIPTKYETEAFPFVYNQGESNMCCACAFSAVRYLQESDKDQSGLAEPFSPEFVYGNRDSNEIYEGMQLRSCCKHGRDGIILYRELSNFCSVKQAYEAVNKSKDSYLKKAKPFAITSFYVCRSRAEVQQAIIEHKAVIIGIPVYDSFYDVGKDGIIYFDSNKDTTNYGGHAVTLTGWCRINGKLYWRLLNSWGFSWGDNGYCWLPEEYPWIEDAYCIVDENHDITYTQYINEFYRK